MNHEYETGNAGLTRRNFIKTGAAGATGIALAGLAAARGQDASATGNTQGAAGTLPRRRYGRTGLEISALVGASDWSPAIIPLAVQAGVNYWHKAQRWSAQDMPAAIKSQPR